MEHIPYEYNPTPREMRDWFDKNIRPHLKTWLDKEMGFNVWCFLGQGTTKYRNTPWATAQHEFMSGKKSKTTFNSLSLVEQLKQLQPGDIINTDRGAKLPFVRCMCEDRFYVAISSGEEFVLNPGQIISVVRPEND